MAGGDQSARAAILAHVAGHVARAAGFEIGGAPLRLLRHDGTGPDPGPPPAAIARPELLGEVHEALLGRDERRRGGAFFTPDHVAAAVVAACLPSPADASAVRVCDPAAGGGVFLLAAARRLARGGRDLADIVGTCLFGVDVDPLAVAVTEAALAILGWDGSPPRGLGDHVLHGDALGVGTQGAESVPWSALAPEGFDAVVGNPPFLNQLASSTARTVAASRDLAARYGTAARGYSDSACLFLLLALDIASPGGRVGMVLPESLMASRDAAATRRRAARSGTLRWVWLGGAGAFGASVRAWAPVFELGSPREAGVTRVWGPDLRPTTPRRLRADALAEGRSWAWLSADLAGVPDVRLPGTGVVGDVAVVTADFRDQFYGLVPFVVDGPETVADERAAPRLVTSGLVHPAACLWGRRPARFAGRVYLRPRVHVERLVVGSKLGPWARSRLVPKLVVATQTQVLEAVVDEHGTWLPSVPTITLAAPPDRLWHLAAALTSPALTAWALREWGGTALSSGALKVSARQAASLPLPPPGRFWDRGAAAVRAAHDASAAGDAPAWRRALECAGEAMCLAYGLSEPDDVLAWWARRLPAQLATRPAAAAPA